MSKIYNNPIIAGFAPDPSVVFVEGTFFLVNSSFHIFPGLPIYASRDLASWTQIGNAISTPSQLDLSNATTDTLPIGPSKILVATMGLFAPTIRWHNGEFYIICTNAARKDGGELYTNNFYIKSVNIWANEWSDPIWFEYDGIDPSLLFNDKTGKAYVQGSWREGTLADRNCSIRQFEIDIVSGKRLSEIQVIWRGDAGSDGKTDIEGPHMYQKDGFYYIIAADGGTFEGHKAVMARSRDVWGPFEAYDKNPVLTAAGTDEYIQNVGHADLFQDGSGAWWAVALGVRYETGGRCPIGRETFLIPVHWPAGKWPVFDRAKMQFERPALPLQSGKDSLPSQNERIDDVYIRNANLNDYTFSPHSNWIALAPGTNGLSATHGTTTFVGKRQRSSNCTATATLYISSDPGLKAGLTLYKEDVRHVDICYDNNTGKVRLEACFKLKGEPKVIAEIPVTAQKVQFQIPSSPLAYEFSIRAEAETDWTFLGSIDALEMVACDFNGTIFGIFAVTTSNEESLSTVKFGDFSVS